MIDRRLNQDPVRVRRRRIAAGMGVQALAQKAGVAKSYVWNVERGKVNASPEKLGQIAGALDCTIADLMPFAPDEAKSA